MVRASPICLLYLIDIDFHHQKPDINEDAEPLCLIII